MQPETNALKFREFNENHWGGLGSWKQLQHVDVDLIPHTKVAADVTVV